MTIKSKFAYIIVFFCLIIFTGCSIKEASKNTPDGGDLRARATAYWQLKVNEDFMKCYEYEAPYYRKQESMVKYLKGMNPDLLKYISAVPGDIKIDNDSAVVDVKLRVRVRPPQMKSMEYDSIISEKWVKSEGIWYHIPGAVDSRSVN